MNVESKSGVHWSFWVIGVLALIWNIMGVMNFFMQMNTEALASFPESHRVIIEGRPAWATAGFALAVFGGTIGSILLLLKKLVAYQIFIASLIGAIIQLPPWLRINGPVIGFFSPLLVAFFLIWYSKHTKNKGWIS